MLRFGTALIALSLSIGTSSYAYAAPIIDTGAGTAAPNFAGIGVPTNQDRTYGQFSFAQDTYVTGIEFYGLIVRAGTINLGIFADGPGGNEPGLNQYLTLQTIAATPGSIGWFGPTNLGNVFFRAGTYWVGSGTDGVFQAIQYGSAPNPLVNESTRNVLSANYNDADSLDLSWRISGSTTAPGAVPEPATWAMMTLGAAAAGVAMRRRRRVVTRVAFAG